VDSGSPITSSGTIALGVDATALRSHINVEDGADVTNETSVTAAGAVMDSEASSLSGIKTLTVPDNTTISAFGASFVDDADAATARTTLGLGTAATSATGDFEAAGAVSTHAAVTSGVHGISAFGASLVDDADAATARTTLGVDAAGTDNSTDVTLAGTPDYITISGQVITRNAVDLAADITGTLPIANGGTGVTALSSIDAADLGSGAGTDGYVLTADGAGGAAWEAAAAGGSSVTVSDSAPVSPSNGDLWFKSDTGVLYIYYIDADGGQWVLPDANVTAGAGITTGKAIAMAIVFG